MRFLELKIPPPIVALAFGLLMALAAQATAPFAWPATARVAAALALVAVGAAFDAAGLYAFVRARTTINPLRPGSTSALVTGGIYRWTRNPMYVGMAMLLAAWATYLANGAAFLLLPFFVLYITRFQIMPEERILDGIFGAQFRAYRERVRRWL